MNINPHNKNGMNKVYPNLSIAAHPVGSFSARQKTATAIGLAGLFILALAICNIDFPYKEVWLAASIVFIFTGVILFANDLYLNKPAGIHWNAAWFKSMSSRGLWAWGGGHYHYPFLYCFVLVPAIFRLR